AIVRSSYADAVAHFGRGLDALHVLGDEAERLRFEIELHVRMGNALFAAEGYDSKRARTAFGRAREISGRLVNQSDGSAFRVLLGLWASLFASGHLDESLGCASDAMRLAERTQRKGRLVWGHTAAGTTLLQLGRVREAEDHLVRVTELYSDELHRREPIEDPC